MSQQKVSYLTTEDLASLIKNDSRTKRNRAKDSVLFEGFLRLRPFSGTGWDIQMSRNVLDAFNDQYAVSGDLSEFFVCNFPSNPIDTKPTPSTPLYAIGQTNARQKRTEPASMKSDGVKPEPQPPPISWDEMPSSWMSMSSPIDTAF